MTPNQPITGFLAQNGSKPAFKASKCGLIYRCKCKLLQQRILRTAPYRLTDELAARARTTDFIDFRSGALIQERPHASLARQPPHFRP
jgi:hypothetical protein